MKQCTISADRKLRAHRLRTLSEKRVVFAVDSGTLQERFLAVVLHSGDAPSFMVGMKDADSFAEKNSSLRQYSRFLEEGSWCCSGQRGEYAIRRVLPGFVAPRNLLPLRRCKGHMAC